MIHRRLDGQSYVKNFMHRKKAVDKCRGEAVACWAEVFSTYVGKWLELCLMVGLDDNERAYFGF